MLLVCSHLTFITLLAFLAFHPSFISVRTGSLVPTKGCSAKKLDYNGILELCIAAESVQPDDLDRLSLVRELGSNLRNLTRIYIKDLTPGSIITKTHAAALAESNARLQVKNKLRTTELKEKMKALKAATIQTENLFNRIEQVQEEDETTEKRLDNIEKVMNEALEQLAGKKRKSEAINT